MKNSPDTIRTKIESAITALDELRSAIDAHADKLKGSEPEYGPLRDLAEAAESASVEIERLRDGELQPA